MTEHETEQPEPRRKEKLSDEELVERIASKVAQQIKQTQPPKKTTVFGVGMDALTAQKSIQSDYMLASQQDENVALLNAQPPFGQSIEEAMASEAFARRGILKAWESRHKKRGIPLNIIAVTIIAALLIYTFGNNKDLWLQAGAFFNDPTNKLYTIIGAVIFVIALYIIFRRRRRRAYG